MGWTSTVVEQLFSAMEQPVFKPSFNVRPQIGLDTMRLSVKAEICVDFCGCVFVYRAFMRIQSVCVCGDRAGLCVCKALVMCGVRGMCRLCVTGVKR